MNIKDKQGVRIEFLLLEDVPARKSENAAGTRTAQLRTIALQYSDGSAKFTAAAKDSATAPQKTFLTRN
jgi:hypothetical protein